MMQPSEGAPGHSVTRMTLGEQLLGRWVRSEQDRQAGEPTGELSVDERAELTRLRRDVDELRKGLLYGWVTSELACLLGGLEGCASCLLPTPESSVRTLCGWLGPVRTVSRSRRTSVSTR